MIKKLLILIFLMPTLYMQAQREMLTINSEFVSRSDTVTEQFVVQKAGDNTPQVTIEAIGYVFGVVDPTEGRNRALAIFEVTPNSHAVKHKGGYFFDATFQQYGYDFLVNYCRSIKDEEYIFTTSHKDTIQCYSEDIIHVIFIAEDANGIQGEPVYLKITVPVPTGIEVAKNNDLQLFPIPNNGNFTISVDNRDENAIIDIFSITGTKVYSADVSSGTLNINLPNLSDGIYLVRYTSKKRSMIKHLVIKK